jgi:GDP-D-mannose dehydratase
MSALRIKDPAIPFGSWVVISGVSGFIGSHVADQALVAGYKVRGTTRDVQKSDWIKKHFEEIYGPGNFELVEVRDMAAEEAFDKVVIGELSDLYTLSHTKDPNVLTCSKAPPVLSTSQTT